jgi:SAM-dependent methyltransferase
MDPFADSAWSSPSTVAGFAASPPNARLMQLAGEERERLGSARVVDIGCGAGRNLIPLARMGWVVLGLDLSWPMLCAAVDRARHDGLTGRVLVAQSPMDAIPAREGGADLVVAHGIWNLAPSTGEFRRAVAEAARVAASGALLFVFTFSRHTIAPDATPVPGEAFVFTEFSGQPQCFLTETQLLDEMQAAGFDPDPDVPLREHNLPRPGHLRSGAPVIYEGGFRRSAIRS